MREAENNVSKAPRVGFERVEHRDILTINERFISLPDITPGILVEYLDIAKDGIHAQLNVLKEMRKSRTNPELNPNVLIGRLTLMDTEDRALEYQGLSIRDPEALEAKDLLHSYREYWRVIERASFVPLIFRQILTSNEQVAGTWLGLKEQSRFFKR
ncbi:MAG: hypothetical protein WAQ27_00820 [Candidatus Microsaccharimonas sp.]